MRYEIKYCRAIFGDTIPLVSVAEGMAKHAATGYGSSKTVHGPTLKNAKRNFIELLLDAANSGALPVCASTGRAASVAKIVDGAAVPGLGDGFNTSERTIFALYARAKHLCDWGAANGHDFELVDVPAQEAVFDLKDEDGKVLKKDYFRGYVGTEQDESLCFTVRPILASATELRAPAPPAALANISAVPGIPAAPTQSNAPENGTAKAKLGRPRENHKKIAVLRKLIGVMIAGKSLNASSLPGSAADLLDACQRIERAQTGKAAVFGGATTPGTFDTWLRAAGYGMKVGRTPKKEKTYWTDLCVETQVKMSPDIFT